MNSQYMEDLYNYCCLKTAHGNNKILRNIDNKKYIKKFNDILLNINKSYINKIKVGANNGNNYALIYKGEIPDNIIDNLDNHLCKFFKHFKILIALDVQSILDILISDYNIYNIYIIWEDNKELHDTSTNTENDENDEKDEDLTIYEEVEELVDENLMDEFELINDVEEL